MHHIYKCTTKCKKHTSKVTNKFKAASYKSLSETQNKFHKILFCRFNKQVRNYKKKLKNLHRDCNLNSVQKRLLLYYGQNKQGVRSDARQGATTIT